MLGQSDPAGIMLIATNSSYGARPVHPDVSRSEYYFHLIGGAGQGLAPATCICLDGIAADVPMDALLDLVEHFFAEEGCKPRIVLVEKKGEDKSPSRTMKWIREAAASGEGSFRRTVDSLQFFPKGRSTIEATWWPSVYIAASVGPTPASAFLCVNRLLDEAELLRRTHKVNALFRSCAAYGFYFPSKFSPLGYYWGISVNPGRRREGEYANSKSNRLSNWRDNTRIGIDTDGVRRFYSACDGYVRDAYPLMLLSARHMERRAGATTLADAIKNRRLGSVAPEGEKFLWRIPAEKLAEVQKLLDDNDISLSGRRMDFEQPTMSTGVQD